MKYRAKRLLQWLGLDRNRRQRTYDMAGFLAQLRSAGFVPRTVIDVGVADGTFELYEAFPDSQLCLIEPLAEFEPALRFIVRRYEANYVLAAAGETDRTARLEHFGALDGASLLKERPDATGTDPTSVPVRVRRLDGLMEELKAEGPYLLKIDVQGGELQALAGAEAVLRETEVVILETSLFRFKHGMPVFHEVVSYMHQRGFVPYAFFGASFRPYDGAMAQIDVAFVPEASRLREVQLWQTAEQARKTHFGLIRRARRQLGV